MSHNDIRDRLEKVRDRLATKGISLNYIVVDKCCGPSGEEKFYKSIFSEKTNLKLDLFYAVQRAVRQFPDKTTPEVLLFCKEFGLIFRLKADEEEKRKKETAEPALINKNLNNLLTRLSSRIDKLQLQNKENLYDEIRKLQVHIEKGCLSDLCVGSGTEGKERLHKLLNSSVLRGVVNIGPELIQAILTELFFSYNCKKLGKKHDCNKKNRLVQKTTKVNQTFLHFMLKIALKLSA